MEALRIYVSETLSIPFLAFLGRLPCRMELTRHVVLFTDRPDHPGAGVETGLL